MMNYLSYGFMLSIQQSKSYLIIKKHSINTNISNTEGAICDDC